VLVHPQKRIFVAINLLGGLAVLGSYAYGLLTHPENSGALWGEVPSSIRVPYALWMPVAAAGYFAFTSFLLLRTDPDTMRVAGCYSFGLFNLLFVLILAPSAAWMPLTFEMLENPGPGLWLAIRLVLWTVGLASLALIGALWALRPREPIRAYRLAVAGGLAFAIQTAVIDAVIWVFYFPA
jgi:hypothetical protein